MLRKSAKPKTVYTSNGSKPEFVCNETPRFGEDVFVDHSGVSVGPNYGALVGGRVGAFDGAVTGANDSTQSILT